MALLSNWARFEPSWMPSAQVTTSQVDSVPLRFPTITVPSWRAYRGQGVEEEINGSKQLVLVAKTLRVERGTETMDFGRAAFPGRVLNGNFVEKCDQKAVEQRQPVG
uniref:Uncharacterized protein n=1 Tax=Anopheles atroparvus TaxID=41427 RepID=A0A182IV68_ANOAO